MPNLLPVTVEVTPSAPLKKGWQTTEFWITILTQIATVGGAIAGILPPKEAALVAAFSQAAYAISRGMAKSAQAN